MKNILKSIFILIITFVIVYALNDKYNLVEWLTQIQETSDTGGDETFINQVRAEMLEGKNQIILQYIGNSDDMDWFTEEAMDMVYSIDDVTTSSDYDYLRYKTESIFSHISGFGNVATVTYDVKYNESEADTEQVENKISELFLDWKMDNLSDYHKIKKIHDYIVNNASYDVKLERYAAYDNLMNQSSTCQGYTSLAYKMLTEAGIPCRIISGTGDGGSHAWNIVKLDGYWYNLDCTWDDPLTSDGEEILTYDFFLKSEDDFEGHVRDREYRTEKFYGEYVMGERSYENKK